MKPLHARVSAAFVRLIVAIAASALAHIACAQPWQPTRPVALVVGATPGGSLDLTARLLQRIFEQQKLVPTPVIVLNKPGAGQGLAWEYMQDRGNDGHAIALGGPNLASNLILGAHAIGYQNVTTIALLFDDYTALIVRAESPLKSMRDVVERLRKDAGALSIGVGPALGGGAHIGAVVGLKAAGVRIPDVRFVVYKSAGDAMIAAIAGEVDLAAGTVANYPSQLAAGRIRRSDGECADAARTGYRRHIHDLAQRDRSAGHGPRTGCLLGNRARRCGQDRGLAKRPRAQFLDVELHDRGCSPPVRRAAGRTIPRDLQ